MLLTAAVLLAASVVAVTLFQRLGLGAVLGYLAAGSLLGPSGFGFVSSSEELLQVAELGVVLLLFLIGLELQPSRLMRMKGMVFGFGGAQVALCTAALTITALAFGLPWRAALVIGLALAMSSTAIATQILGEKKELAAPHGRAAFGVLLFQDIAAIPTLALVPLLGVSTASSTRSPLVQTGLVIGVVVGLILIGRFLLRPLFRLISSAHSQELSTSTALLVVLGTALAVHAVGLSMALGAFLAGVMLADSEYRHELEADIEPFKGILLGLFFMAVGMSANLRLVGEQPVTILGLVAGLVTLKILLVFALGRFANLDRRGGISLGIAVSQGGEFAFVIFSVGATARVFDAALTELLVVVVTLSLVTTPLLFAARDLLLKHLPAGIKREFDEIKDENSRVIIAGFGRVGQIVGRVLNVRGIPYTALDASPHHVDFVRNFGNRVFYGDASRVDLLRAARADRAEVFVLAIDDFDSSMRCLAVVKQNFPNLRIVARARNRQHAWALMAAGVERVIRENFLGSVETARLTLEELGFSEGDAHHVTRTFAEWDEERVRETVPIRNDEKALQESARAYATQLEQILKDDERQAG